MATKIYYQKELLDFVTTIKVSPNNIVVENTLDAELPFVSRYYTAHKGLSELGRYVLQDIQRGQVSYTRKQLDTNSLTYLAKHSGLLTEYPSLTTYFKILILESYAIMYAVEEKASYRKHLNKKDIRKVRTTLKYILDIIGMDVAYEAIITHLQDLDIELGYIEAQADLIRNDVI